MEKEFCLSDNIFPIIQMKMVDKDGFEVTCNAKKDYRIILSKKVKKAVKKILEILDTHLSTQRKREKILKILGDKLV